MKNEYLYSDRVVQAKNDLEQLVKSHKKIIEDNTYDDYTGIQDIEMDQMLDTKIKSKFKKWIKRIETDVDEKFVNQGLNNSTEETDAGRNPYVSQQIIKEMSRIFAKVALFSNVMNPICGSKNKCPNTSGTEAQFRNMKSYVFNLMKSIRFDTWLERSIEVTKGIFKALVSELKETQKSDALTGELSDDSRDDGKPNIEQEPWGGQNVDIEKKTKGIKRLHRNPQSILNPERDDFTRISILKNGGKSKKSGKTPALYSSQTCGPDSYFHLFAACYADSAYFKGIIDQNETSFAEFIRLLASPESTADYQDKIDTYRNRSILELFPETVISIEGLKSVDGECAIADAYTRICKICPVFNSLLLWPKCCDNFIDMVFVKFKLHRFDNKNVQQSILPQQTQNCTRCQKRSKFTEQPQAIVAFDSENSAMDISLNDIQREIEIGGIPYVLLGVTENRPNHFVAHALRAVGSSDFQWVEYDDLLPKHKKHDNFIAKRVVMILYRNNERHQAEESEVVQIDSPSSAAAQVPPEAEKNDENDETTEPTDETAEQLLSGADKLLSQLGKMKVATENSDKNSNAKESSKRKKPLDESSSLSPKKRLRNRPNE